MSASAGLEMIKKYAVSRSGEVDTSWQGSVLLRDIGDVKRLRDEEGPNRVTQDSTELVHALMANDLVDAMTIFTVPVVLGSGKKAVCRRLDAPRLQADKIARFEHGRHDRTL